MKIRYTDILGIFFNLLTEIALTRHFTEYQDAHVVCKTIPHVLSVAWPRKTDTRRHPLKVAVVAWSCAACTSDAA